MTANINHLLALLTMKLLVKMTFAANLIFLLVFIAPSYAAYSKKLKIGGQILCVEIVKDPAAMARGLSGRPPLKENQGMLFDFRPQLFKPAFWMKGMQFAIDILWLKDFKIVEITQNIDYPKNPNTLLKVHSPRENINQVLEVNAGWAKKHHLFPQN